MDRGGKLRERQSGTGTEGVAAGASARVGEILAEAERHGQAAHEEAERAAEATSRSAHERAERLLADARTAARAEARTRADHLAAIQAALAARGPAVVEGLERAGITRSRLEKLIAALAEAAEGVLAEAEGGDARRAGGGSEDGDLAREGEAEAADEDADAAPVDEASAPVEEDADEVPSWEPLDAPGEGAEEAPEAGDGEPGAGGNGEPDVEVAPVPYEGELPEGAPMMRRPVRTKDRDARFAALLLALQGRERRDVEAHLRAEHEVSDFEAILDEVFGRADARA
jgi:hypothetical protein